MLHSTMGRHARTRDPLRDALRARAEALAAPGRQHREGRHGDLQPAEFPKGEVEGVGFHEAPRGTLSHWVVIDDGKIKNYQAVVPTTWNASPRDNERRSPAVRSVAAGQSDRRPGAAARSPADRALVRSVHGVRVPHVRSVGQARRR